MAEPDVPVALAEVADVSRAQSRRPRRRDPARKDRILAAAAELVARHGYHAVGMADIGAAAGIVGSGIYRHFGSKSALLSALLEQLMGEMQSSAAAAVAEAADDRDALERLVVNHVRFAIEDRRLLQVYYREAHHLPEEDLRRLRRAQRHYVEEWVIVLAPLRRELSDAELRVVVHGALGTTQAVLFHHSGLPADRLAEMLVGMARSVLGSASGERVPASVRDEG
ncbi:TetR/AcrR family transcriptional regulator [Actinomycetospora sp. NBRC 106378]|uniref:TetR/AcrR family transcriptional regulator n=1 Tax=Actinomycetospora sp. NBRC 106378 TaxID=3032208 RepID=UPI0024A03A5E|nr:TetR/AcrR family transcriptional regulator [Actinomycetospora sp. NBRC 106378]GLZ51301.1 TetR family transcriptional regulator [Actinomycetospora sp. NBRC 106378]